MEFVLWSSRLNGWATDSGNYISDFRLARKFTREEAIKRAKLQYQTRTEEFGIVPVPYDLIEEIRA